jgi:hypothetical protein
MSVGAWINARNAHGITEDLVQLLIHEFAHEYSADHLSSDYHQALCRIGARLFMHARKTDPTAAPVSNDSTEFNAG